MTERFFKERWLGLLAAYPNTNVTKQTQQIYFEHVKDLREDKFDQAVRQCILELKFFPTVAEIRERLPRREHKQLPALPDLTELESIKVLEFIRELRRQFEKRQREMLTPEEMEVRNRKRALAEHAKS